MFVYSPNVIGMCIDEYVEINLLGLAFQGECDLSGVFSLRAVNL